MASELLLTTAVPGVFGRVLATGAGICLPGESRSTGIHIARCRPRRRWTASALTVGSLLAASERPPEFVTPPRASSSGEGRSRWRSTGSRPASCVRCRGRENRSSGSRFAGRPSLVLTGRKEKRAYAATVPWVGLRGVVPESPTTFSGGQTPSDTLQVTSPGGDYP